MFESKPRTTAELAAYYSVSKTTFKTWLKYAQAKGKLNIERKGNLYTPEQVKQIIVHFGKIEKENGNTD